MRDSRTIALDLTLALVITSNMIISCQSASTHFFRKSEIHARKMNPFGKNELPEVGADYMKRPKRANLLQKWAIPAIHIQLDIAIDRYHFLNQTMQDLYYGAIGCGPGGCHNFEDVIPKPTRHSGGVIYKKRRKHLGKRIYELLELFHVGLQKIQNSYGQMIKYENSTGFYDRVREKVLQELRTDVKMLDVEVESSLTVKPDAVLKNDDIVHYTFPFPMNHTDLIIQEWYVIQESKKFLTQWHQILTDLEEETKRLKSGGGRSKKLSKSKQKSRKKTKLHKKKAKSRNS
ncbi:UNVERIFIED_CONTAM: hypothetical protein PYX00_007227 [Menopon gallinae]|uniref:Uncharacterized protein n=1 Tax=Menopon gallinae TaxID=328185 RepID=A0AAW2HI69_9NEOP